MAWLGGRIEVPERLFVGLLGSALLFTALSMFFGKREQAPAGNALSDGTNWRLGLPLGGGVGLLAGVVGIGGGIFLAPILHLLNWGRARSIAAATSVFILVNSAAGLTGQLMKLGDLQRLGALDAYYWLFAAVLVGGQIGSRVGSRKLPGRSMQILTGILVGFVALRLLHRYFVTG